MASWCLPLRNSAFPDSRSLVMLADRLGFTGTGGGGTGDSRARNERWRLFNVASSSWREREVEVEVKAFEVGSMRMGKSVKLLMSSMAER